MSNGLEEDFYGKAVAVSADGTVFVGAPGDDRGLGSVFVYGTTQ